MAQPSDSALPTAAYLTFVDGAELPAGERASDVLEARLLELSGLPQPDFSMGVDGDGVLLSFSHPNQTLAYVRGLLTLLRSQIWELPPLRIGVHVAAMTRDTSTNEPTISGSSIDGAMRVAILAEPNQALTTAQFQTVLVHLLKVGSGVLSPLGRRTTPSGKSLEVFEIVSHQVMLPDTMPAPTAAAHKAEAPADLSAEILSQVEHALAEHIGPIARVLVKQASSHLPDQNRFLVRLADAIPEPDKRREFLARATKITSG